MPRISKNRGKPSTYRGISHHKVCILSAMDDHDQTIFRVQGVGVETTERANQLLRYINSQQSKNSLLITDMKQVYDKVTSQLEIKHIEVKAGSHVTEDGYSLSGINQLHSEFSLLYRKYRGVSIRHLQGYLDFFAYCKNLTYRITKLRDKSYYTYDCVSKEKSHLNVSSIHKKALPIDLFLAYGDWHFGCFAS